MLKNTTTI